MKPINFLSKKTIIFFSSTILLYIVVIIGFYILNFAKSGISDNPVNWGVFGDYIGGLLNPIISLASLVVLGYLTYFMSKQSNEESKKLFFLQQKILAYHELAAYYKDIFLFAQKSNHIFNILPEKLDTNNREKEVLDFISKFQEISFVFSQFYATLITFENRYDHLFKYNFNNQKFDELINLTSKIEENIQNFLEAIKEGKHRNEGNKLIESGIFILLNEVLKELQKELH